MEQDEEKIDFWKKRTWKKTKEEKERALSEIKLAVRKVNVIFKLF